MAITCTREQVREIDRRAVDDYGIPGMILMENAGRGAAQVAANMLERPANRRVVIFCGKGNNGGDGYVIARHLHNLQARVDVILAFQPDEIHPESDAGINLGIVRKMSIAVHVAETQEAQTALAAVIRQADLVIDALLGTGLSGNVREPYLSLIRLINADDKPVLAVDIPSGLDANTGTVLRAAVRATRTATFVLPKEGFETGEGPAHVGEVAVVDIGVPRELIEAVIPEA